jgi:glycosyltransferase involved in cell wall biosynthesis
MEVGAETRRIDVVADGGRDDLLVHALAQLPDEVGVRLPDGPGRAAAEGLASAYGISERISFEAEAELDATRIHASTMAEIVHELSGGGDPFASIRLRDEALTGHRIALLTNLPAPYRIALFEGISERIEAAGGKFRVFFMGKRSRGRPWMEARGDLPFDHEWLSSFELPLGVRHPLVPVNLGRRLAAFEPSIVLTAGFSPLASGRAATFARRHKAVLGIWSGEIPGRRNSGGRLRRSRRKRLLRRADFAIAYGYLAGEYLRDLRPELPVVYGRNTSNAHALQRRPPDRAGVVRLLAVADMAKPEKGIDLLVAAMRKLPDLSCSLTVAGPGAEASGLREAAGEDRRITFLGALPQVQVRERYAESDVFLFPSSAEADVFGLALVEAMGSGVAPLIATGPGAAADLAIDRWNCLLVRERTAEAWAAAIQEVVSNDDLRLELERNARTTIESRWTVTHACDAMLAGLRLGLLATSSDAIQSSSGKA